MKTKKLRIYIEGRGFLDVAKAVFDKLVSNNALKVFAASAVKKGAETVGNRVGEFAANKVADKLIPKAPEHNTISVLEELENKVKSDIENYAQKGRGYKVIR